MWYNIHTEIVGGRRAAAAPFSAVCRAGDHSRYGSLRRPPSGPPPIFLKTVQTIRTVSTAGAYRRAAACSCPAAAQRAGGSSALAACTTAGTA